MKHPLYLLSQGLSGASAAMGAAQMQDAHWWGEAFFPQLEHAEAVFLPSEHVGEASLAVHQVQAGLVAPVFACGTSGSAFDVAWQLNRHGLLPEWGSVLAWSQTAGRGQLRRHWESPAGNIYAVLRLPRSALFATAAASVLVGYLLARAFSFIAPTMQIKWPNDLMLHDKKVGGILLEERGDVLLAGCGINLVHTPAADCLRAGRATEVSSLAQELASAGSVGQALLGAVPLWCLLVQRMLADFYGPSSLVAQGQTEPDLEFILPLVTEKLAWMGRTVLLSDVAEKVQGQVLGLAFDGALRISTEAGERCIRSGSIMLLS